MQALRKQALYHQRDSSKSKTLPLMVDLHPDAGLIHSGAMNVAWSLSRRTGWSGNIKVATTAKEYTLASGITDDSEFEFNRGELGNGRANTEKP